jgi:murein DD-endopeptidase MepM/ murein hydrolase activator NlpD
MSRVHLWLPFILQLVVPLLLLVWLAFGRHHGLLGWALTGVLVGAYLLAATVAGLWLVLPGMVAYAYILLLALALARSFRAARRGRAWPEALRPRLVVGARGALAAGTVALALHALSGRRPPDGPMVDLAFPLGAGTFYVANGGSVELINAHLATLDAQGKARAYRGQSHGVDIEKLNRWGTRAGGIAPGDPAAYAIFGEPVLAPCTGMVALAEDGDADLSPPSVDREQMAGNHVVLDCGGVWVLLGHLRRGSVCVGEGDTVLTGDRVGAVGNSGNTSEPHLHVHAQRPGTAEEPFGGEPLPILFDGQYVARNAVTTR